MLQGSELYPYFRKCGIVDTDTRNIRSGSIFFALKGDNFNGNIFASKALESGALYAVVDEKKYCTDQRYLLVDDSLKALQELARYHRQQLSIPVLAITGSNGKTTTKELIRSVLATRYKTFATFGNLNNHIGVPLSLLSLNKTHEMAIIEMGANHQKEIATLASIAEPNMGLITNIGKAHLEGFGGLEGVKKGKGELYDFLKANKGHIFVNAESPALMDLLSDYQPSSLYGYTDACLLKGKLINADPYISLEWSAFDYKTRYSVQSNLTGAYNLDNVLAAITIGLHFNILPEMINNGIKAYIPDNKRSQLIETGKYKIVADYYNANPTSMMASIDAFIALKDENKWLFLGDMLELAEESKSEHQAIIDHLIKMKQQNVILVGPIFMSCELTSPYQHFNTSSEAAEWLESKKPEQALILIKGSRGIKMENIMQVFSPE